MKILKSHKNFFDGLTSPVFYLLIIMFSLFYIQLGTYDLTVDSTLIKKVIKEDSLRGERTQTNDVFINVYSYKIKDSLYYHYEKVKKEEFQNKNIGNQMKLMVNSEFPEISAKEDLRFNYNVLTNLIYGLFGIFLALLIYWSFVFKDKFKLKKNMYSKNILDGFLYEKLNVVSFLANISVNLIVVLIVFFLFPIFFLGLKNVNYVPTEHLSSSEKVLIYSEKTLNSEFPNAKIISEKLDFTKKITLPLKNIIKDKEAIDFSSISSVYIELCQGDKLFKNLFLLFLSGLIISFLFNIGKLILYFILRPKKTDYSELEFMCQSACANKNSFVLPKKDNFDSFVFKRSMTGIIIILFLLVLFSVSFVSLWSFFSSFIFELFVFINILMGIGWFIINEDSLTLMRNVFRIGVAKTDKSCYVYTRYGINQIFIKELGFYTQDELQTLEVEAEPFIPFLPFIKVYTLSIMKDSKREILFNNKETLTPLSIEDATLLKDWLINKSIKD